MLVPSLTVTPTPVWRSPPGAGYGLTVAPGEFQMRLDEAGAGQAPSCAGFQVSFDKEETEVRLLPGNRLLPEGLAQAGLKGLSQAPQLLGHTLPVPPPRHALHPLVRTLPSA